MVATQGHEDGKLHNMVKQEHLRKQELSNLRFSNLNNLKIQCVYVCMCVSFSMGKSLFAYAGVRLSCIITIPVISFLCGVCVCVCVCK